MENTLENRSKFFNQYHRQNLNSNKGKCCLRDADFVDELEWVELKNIDNITDEHAVLLGFENASDFFIDGSTYAMIDDLRLLGYAVDWSDLSVDELIEYGWIKLI